MKIEKAKKGRKGEITSPGRQDTIPEEENSSLFPLEREGCKWG